VLFNGNETFSGYRHYFIARHDRIGQGSFLYHGDIDNKLFGLGS